MDLSTHIRGLTRRTFGVSLGAGAFVLAIPAAGVAALKKVPTSTGIDALFAPFVVAAERKMFEKYDLETSFKPFDDGNVTITIARNDVLTLHHMTTSALHSGDFLFF